MKKILVFFVSIFLLWLSFSYNSELWWFFVKVNPKIAKVWQPIDLVIKAVDKEGRLLNNYKWDIIIQVMDGDKELNISDYMAPNDGTYSFTEEDMWQKKFTKWLIINKKWDFKVRVEDFDTALNWETDVKVVWNAQKINNYDKYTDNMNFFYVVKWKCYWDTNPYIYADIKNYKWKNCIFLGSRVLK